MLFFQLVPHAQIHKEFREQRGALFFQHAFYNLRLMVKFLHLQKIQDGSGTTRFGTHAADHNPVDPGLYQGAGAHLTGLQRHIHGHSLQPPVPDFFAGLVDCRDFRMG